MVEATLVDFFVDFRSSDNALSNKHCSDIGTDSKINIIGVINYVAADVEPRF